MASIQEKEAEQISFTSLDRMRSSIQQIDSRRRSSIFNMAELGNRQSLSTTKRTSLIGGMDTVKAKVKYENTFKMEPIGRFLISEVQKLATDVLETSLETEEYDHDRSKMLCCSLADEIKQRVKRIQNTQRHKIVVQVYIGERANTDIKISSRALAHLTYDSWTDAVYINPSLFATAIIHLIYQE